VGTIEVQDTSASASFSGAAASLSTGLGSFTLSGVTKRQVVMLQVSTTTTQFNGIQKYFYGFPRVSTGPMRATNGRGISVWPSLSATDTRIAICGETYDEVIPSSQDPNGWLGASAAHCSGFIAVYDGTGLLLWTHHFFGNNTSEADCAITDVSIRQELDGVGVLRDVVTFCGISSHGNPAANNSLTPVRPFIPPSGAGACTAPAGGFTNNGIGQWDGIVGRISRDHANTLPTTVDFLSVVGGTDQDGLFGIDEIDTNRFVVVGSTALSASTVPGNGLNTFPWTDSTCLSGVAAFCVGTEIVFDAAPTRTGGSLRLESAVHIGAIGADASTIARDVLVQRGAQVLGLPNSVFVVGSTSDSSLLTSIISNPTPGAFGGGTDGFVLAFLDAPLAGLPPFFGAFVGGPNNDGLTGIHGWNEFVDHFVATGFTEDATGNRDIEVASFYLNNAALVVPVPAVPTPMITRLTSGQIGGSSSDTPTAMGIINATTLGVPWDRLGLDDPAGGGIDVDETGRVNVVGATTSSNYPVLATVPSFILPRARQPAPDPQDAVRTVLDMLPTTSPSGCGRTDGTGTLTATANTFPAVGGTGFTGGTSPFCALRPFGIQNGFVSSASTVSRMLIDFEGSPSGGTGTAIVVSRPTASSTFDLLGLQFTVPGSVMAPSMLPDGLEIWVTNSPVTFVVGAGTIPPGPLQFLLSPLPLVRPAISAQLFCGSLTGPITAGVFPACTTTTFGALSPAIWF
jgi:hypothetical protein